jgi:hypothetical protein
MIFSFWQRFIPSYCLPLSYFFSNTERMHLKEPVFLLFVASRANSYCSLASLFEEKKGERCPSHLVLSELNRLGPFSSRSVNHEIAIICSIILVKAAIDSLVPTVGLITPPGIRKISGITISTEELIASLVSHEWSPVDQEVAIISAVSLVVPLIVALIARISLASS